MNYKLKQLLAVVTFQLVVLLFGLQVASGSAAFSTAPTTAISTSTQTVTVQPTTSSELATAGSTDNNGLQTFDEGDDRTPLGHQLTPNAARAIARADSVYRKQKELNPGSYDKLWLKGKLRWQLSLFTKSTETKAEKEIAQVIVTDATQQVSESWDGPYVAWTMARGYKGAFGHSINAAWVWGPLLALFLLIAASIRPALIDAQQGRRNQSQSGRFADTFRRLGSLRPPLPLLLIAGFSAALAGFNSARLDIAVPIQFVLLVCLIVWGVQKVLRRPKARADLNVLLPIWLMAALLVVLIAFRATLCWNDGNVIDVGYASIVGANRIASGDSLYGVWPTQVSNGDTYGPVTYLSYIPFEQIWPWQGKWDKLYGARAASIAFDLLTIWALFFVGKRRSVGRGLVYALLWVACPFTAYVMNSGTNDALPALFLTLVLLWYSSPVKRGLGLGFAIASKIAPLTLSGLLATANPDQNDVSRPIWRKPNWSPKTIAVVAIAAAGVVIWTSLIVLHGKNPTLVYDRIIGYQSGRDAPYMPWGFYSWLHGGDSVVRVLVAGLCVWLAVVPRRHDLAAVAAGMAALLFAVQVSGQYWIYHYLVWCLPLVIVGSLDDRAFKFRPTRKQKRHDLAIARQQGLLR